MDQSDPVLQSPKYLIGPTPEGHKHGGTLSQRATGACLPGQEGYIALPVGSYDLRGRNEAQAKQVGGINTVTPQFCPREIR